MFRVLLLAIPLLLAGCLGGGVLPPSAEEPATAEPLTFEPFEAQVELTYSVMGGPMPAGGMGMAEAPLPEGATAAALHAEWSASTPASETLMVMLHAGTRDQIGPMLGGAGGASPLLTEPAFVPEGETSLVLMVMPRGEPAGGAFMQTVNVRVEFFQIERPPAPPKTYVDLVLDGPEGPWNVSLWDAPDAPVSALLLGGGGQSREDWEPHALALRDSGVRIIATDGMRPGQEGLALAALESLRALGSPSVAIVGASLGAGAALLAAASDSGCPSGLGQLSPVPDRAQPARPALAFREYGDRPLFLAVAQEDSFSYPTAQEHRLLAQGEVTYVERAGGAHGTDLLSEEAVLSSLATWLGELPPCGT